MRKTYQVVAWLIAGLVAVQAAVIAFFGSGVSKYIEGAGVIDKALVESVASGGPAPFPELIGVPIHAINGGMLIPVVALVLLAVSFRTGVPGARKWAGVIVGLVVLQVSLGYSQGGLPALGLLHGTNALLLFASALHAGALARRAGLTEAEQQRETAPVA